MTAVLCVGLLSPGTGWAAHEGDGARPPSSSAEAQQQVVELNHQLGILVEEYNAATVTLAEEKAAAAEADTALAAAEGERATLQQRVQEIAASAYTSSVGTGLVALMTSEAPDELIDQMNTIEYLAAKDAATLDSYEAAAAKAADAAVAQEQAVSAAAQTAKSLETQTATIEQHVAEVEELLSQLTEEEQQAALDAHLAAESGNDNATATTAPTNPAPSGPVPAPTEAAGIAVNWALGEMGKPYQWGATGPDSYDCSGLTLRAFEQAGITLPRVAKDQASTGTPVPLDQIQPGDLLYHGSPVYHIGIYIGDGQMVHAPQTGDVVKITDINSFPPDGATRVAT